MKYILDNKNEISQKFNGKKCETILINKLKKENIEYLLNLNEFKLEKEENLTHDQIIELKTWKTKTKNKIKRDYDNYLKNKTKINITEDEIKNILWEMSYKNEDILLLNDIFQPATSIQVEPQDAMNEYFDQNQPQEEQFQFSQ